MTPCRYAVGMEFRFIRLLFRTLSALLIRALGLQAMLARLLRNDAGNTSLIVAGSIIPLLAMVGGGIDMGRSYLTEARLQKACDSGVLAARKKLGPAVVVDVIVVEP